MSSRSASSSVAVQDPAIVAAFSRECPSPPRWTFTQGMLFGQFSILVLVALFLKYIVFEHRPSSDPTSKSKRTSRAKRRTNPKSTSSTSRPSATTSQILSTLEYDLSSHAPESLDWLNVLLAQTLSAYRALIFSSSAEGPKGLMESILNRKSSSGESDLVAVDWINVEEVHVGEAYPLLGDARVRPSGAEGGAVRVELDLDYIDRVSLSISTSLLFNFPRPRFAVLPISLGLTLERFSGTLTLELPTPTSHHPNPSVHVSLHPDFELDISTTSLLGARAKLHDVPKVEQLVRERLRSFIVDKVVWPGRVAVALPAPLSPRPANPPSSDLSEEFSDNDDSFSPASIVTPLPRTFLSDQDLEDDDVDHDDEPFDVPLHRNFTSISAATQQQQQQQQKQRRPSFSGAPSVDLEDPEGPSVTLHPRLNRKRSRMSTAAATTTTNRMGTGAGGRPPSPTESIPGFYRPPAPVVESGGTAGLRRRTSQGQKRNGDGGRRATGGY